MRIAAIDERLISQRVEECREGMKRGLLASLRMPRPPADIDDKGRLESYDTLEQQIWRCLEDGELDAMRHKLILDLIREQRGEIPHAVS